tara:strand:+ start:328 stop:2139 length:1812 start_codon:yes stop_codon:yes gene_type:complete
MSDQKYAVNQHLVSSLISFVKSGEIAIPEIQRPFVWKPTKVRDLMDSLYKGYPIGYIIAWKNPHVKLKDGSMSEGKKILIDGQQRITALTAAIVGQKVVNDEYKEIQIRIAFNPSEETFEVSNPAIEKSKEWISDISPVLEGDVGLLALVRDYHEDNPDQDERNLERVFTKLMGIPQRQIGLIELAADLEIETVTEIFIRINSQGVVLSQADFVMSKIAANEEFGGVQLRKAIDYFCHLAIAPEFFAHVRDNDEVFTQTDYFPKLTWLKDENDDIYDPTYNDMLRVAFMSKFKRGRMADLVSLLSGRNFETREYEEKIEENSYKLLKEGVIDFMSKTDFQRLVMIITSAGFVVSKLIRAQAPVNFAYTLFLVLRNDPEFKGAMTPERIEKLVRRWYVMSVLTGRYTGSPESRFTQDLRMIAETSPEEVLRDIETAELSDAFWEAGLVARLTTSSINNPSFLVFLAAQAHGSDKGFLSKEITVKNMLEYRGDVHHLFPKAYLKNAGFTRAKYNQVANMVYMQSETNIAVGAKPPREYMAIVAGQCESSEPKLGGITSVDELAQNLEAHAIPEGFADCDISDYEEFLSKRRSLMAQKIRAYYEGL